MRRRAAAPPPVPTASAPAAPARTSSASTSPAPAGLPASFAGIGALLADAGERVPADALTLTAVTAAAGSGSTVDLSGIWMLDAAMAAARSNTVLRALDGKGRLMLPLEAAGAARVPAERDGAVLTVFLPGAAEGPRPNFAVAPLPLDARGRLTLTTGVRRAAGIPDGADVYAQIDLERQTVTVTAASRLTAALADALDGLRSPSPASDRADTGSTDTVPVGLPIAAGAPSDEPNPDRRLRSVG
ncbi:hypothetical protein [Geodermatophilus sabuli]|uniref:hypothetical protein n=1 Tax=Geodermatophilus sabuli TaxID=1564158 RepID=UPI000BE3E13F|nr:hypothetical protein [Geodermatophilus sabuli]